MKKFALKVSATAVSLLVSGVAFAGVDVTSGTAVNVGGVLASEYNYNTGVAPKGGPVQEAGGQTTFRTAIGFGVSTGQTRFIRVNLVGATFAAQALPGNGQVGQVPEGDVTGVSLGSNITVVSGGNIGDSTVTYQLTSGAGELQNVVLSIGLPALRVTNANAAPVTASYALYNDAPSSVSQTGALNPNTSAVNLLTFTKALGFTLVPNVTTASVAVQYRQFLPSAGGAPAPVTTASLAPIGRLNFAAATTVAADNVAVLISDLISDASVTVSDGSFGATSGNIYIGNAAGTIITPIPLNVPLTGGTTLPGAFGLLPRTNGADNNVLWYSISPSNLVPIPEQNIKMALSVTPIPGVNAVGAAAATIGTIIRDGTQLQSPFYQTNTGNVSRFVLTNTSNVVANWTAQVYPDAAQTFTQGTITGTIPAGGFSLITSSSLGTYSTANGRGFVVFTIDRPRADIQGVFNYQNVTSGSTSNTVLVSPGTN